MDFSSVFLYKKKTLKNYEDNRLKPSNQLIFLIVINLKMEITKEIGRISKQSQCIHGLKFWMKFGILFEAHWNPLKLS